MKNKKKTKYTYRLELTERQVKILSYVCENFSRLICGQDKPFQDLMETAWEKRCKEAVGGHGMDKEWEGGWDNMRQDAEAICKQIKKRFWGLEWNTLNGIYYDDSADILFDLHQVIRHQLWLDRPDNKKSNITVDASEAVQFGKEPLAKIDRINKYEWKKAETPPTLYLWSETPLYTMISDVVEVRTKDKRITRAVYTVFTFPIPDNEGKTRSEKVWFETPDPDNPPIIELLRKNESINVVEWRYGR